MRILVACLLILLFVPSWTGWERIPQVESGARVTLAPVPLFPHEPGRRRLGALTFLGGVRLSSADRAFGGYSAMVASGNRVTLLSDGGELLQLDLTPDFRLLAARIKHLPDGPGTGWHKEDRDTESLTRDPAGRLWVGFENHNAIWRYAPGFRRAEASAEPRLMAHWEPNGGPEAMTRLPDGRFIVISETTRWPHLPGRAALLFDGDPTRPTTPRGRMIYLPPPGYDVSEAAALPDGRLLVLNRRFVKPFGFNAVLTLVEADAFRPGAVLRGRVIARFEGDVSRDNYEAMGVTREGRDTILWLASDDNQSMLQRSLLLKFRLDLPQGP